MDKGLAEDMAHACFDFAQDLKALSHTFDRMSGTFAALSSRLADVAFPEPDEPQRKGPKRKGPSNDKEEDGAAKKTKKCKRDRIPE